MKKQFIIRHPSQLNSLKVFPILRKSGLGRIVFDESFEHKRREHWEQEINKWYYACGCSQSANALIFGLFVFGILGWFVYLKYEFSITQSLGIFFAGLILMAVVGKLIGLAMAGNELRKTVKEVQSEWNPNWDNSEIIKCG